MRSLLIALGIFLLIPALACSRDETPPPTEQSALVAGLESFDAAPVPVNSVSPEYPEASRRAGESGQTHIEVTVDETGRVEDARVVQSSDHLELDAAAREAALRWTFEPAQKQGEPVRAKIVIPFRFRLN